MKYKDAEHLPSLHTLMLVKQLLLKKLLLFGGAIQIAGAVKSNKINRSTTSDFLEIEKTKRNFSIYFGDGI